jgi:DNA-binding NtrC family response regulator
MTSLNAHDLPEPGARNLDGLRVLIVEDSWQVGAALKRLLETCGADVAGPVATTADAARSISERTIDVALVDINLRGGELAYDLIDQLHIQGIRIVVMTGYANVPLKQGTVAAFLQKPVSAHLLFRSLRPAGQSEEI